jgi:uncharacterized protein YceH (UPF0502 family)
MIGTPAKLWKRLLARFGAIGEVGMHRRLVEVERLDMLGDRADQPLAQRQLGDVDRLLRQPARREQFEHAFAQQIDRADLAIQHGRRSMLTTELSLDWAGRRFAITS